MGAWGHGIWDNDTALDIQGTFEDALKKYDTKVEAMLETVSHWGITDSEFEVLALADLQIEYNCIVSKKIILLAKTICMAKYYIDEWSEPQERAKELDKFLEKIDKN